MVHSHMIWFKRKQRVFVNGVASTTMHISSGVPQGSILGPPLFLIYINYFPQASNFFSMRLFADDTSLTALTVFIVLLYCALLHSCTSVFFYCILIFCIMMNGEK